MKSPHFTFSSLQNLLLEMEEHAVALGFRAETLFENDRLKIPAFSRIGKAKTAPVILLSSGIHGDEPAGLLTMLEFFKGQASKEFTWLVTPLLNPGGFLAGKRENADGIDLNRTYERIDMPEIAGQLTWLSTKPPPALFISLHEDWEASGFYFYEVHQDPQPEIFFREAIHAAVAPFLPLEPGPDIDGHEASAPGWIHHDEIPEIPEGLPEALYFMKQGSISSLTFETPSEAPIEARVGAHLAAIQATVKFFGRS